MYTGKWKIENGVYVVSIIRNVLKDYFMMETVIIKSYMTISVSISGSYANHVILHVPYFGLIFNHFLAILNYPFWVVLDYSIQTLVSEF